MFRKKIWVTVLVSVWVLAACSGGGATTTQAPAATQEIIELTEPPATEAVATEPSAMTEMPVITPTTATTTTPAMTEAPAAVSSGTPAAAELSASEVVYKIVPGESTVSYEVGETFLDQNRFATAIGVTPEVNGEIRLNPANPQAVSIGDITVDVSQLTSDSARRDGALRDRFLLSSQFPTATFRATTIEGLPTAYIEGQEISFKVTGDLTVRETTLPVTFDVVAILRGSQLTGTATSMIKMSDFGVGPISMAILRTEDDVKLAFKFVARP